MKRAYGEYVNVKLTDADLSKLKADFPADWQERIERLSTYMASTGKTYKNHLATIRNWGASRRRARERGQDIPSGGAILFFYTAQEDDTGGDYGEAQRRLPDGSGNAL